MRNGNTKNAGNIPALFSDETDSIETRLSNLSYTETIFRDSTTHYENNLRNLDTIRN